MSHVATARGLPDADLPVALSGMERIGDRWLWLLGFTLSGYLLVGRGFAYLGISPLFIGEITLLAGIVALGCCAHVGKIFGTGVAWLLLAFCGWGAYCTFPYLSVYGMEALRDGVAWGYSAFALIVAALIIARPRRLLVLDRRYRILIKLQLLLGPVIWGLTMVNQHLPTIPGTHVPIIDVKGGDQAVHLTGAYAYLAGAIHSAPTWMALTLLPLNLALNVSGRAATAAFAIGALITGAMLPLSKLTVRLIVISIIVLIIAWSLNLRYVSDADRDREVSVDQLIDNIQSTFGHDSRGDMEGTKEWRLNWWNDIIDYTFHGQYFWTGKGFGINLATSDGYQVWPDESLRNPHSAHMMFLGRGGVPMFVLWIVLQLSWLLMMVRAYLISRSHRQRRWSRLFVFLIAYWAALLVNASFDVFLEGPMGGIWFWTIFGVGMAAMYIHKFQPDTISDDDENPDGSQFLSASRR